MSAARSHGFGIVEVIVGIAVLVLMVAAAMQLAYTALDGTARGERYREARALAFEGIVALEDIAGNSFDLLNVSGTFGIATTSGGWTLTSSPDTVRGYTRSITLDAIDDETVHATATVSWSEWGSVRQVYFASTLRDWRQTGGGRSRAAVDAEAFSAASSSADGIAVLNVSTEPYTITAIEFTFAGSGTIRNVLLDGVSVWSAGEGAGAPSGSSIDVDDVAVGAGEHVGLSFEYAGDVSFAPLRIGLKVGDGTVRYAYVYE